MKFTNIFIYIYICIHYFITNLGLPNFTEESVSSPGASNGLELTLNVQVYEYNLTALAIGLKVRVHDQIEPALTSDLGFAVMPGAKAFVSVTKKRVGVWLQELHCRFNLMFVITLCPKRIEGLVLTLEPVFQESSCGFDVSWSS